MSAASSSPGSMYPTLIMKPTPANAQIFPIQGLLGPGNLTDEYASGKEGSVLARLHPNSIFISSDLQGQGTRSGRLLDKKGSIRGGELQHLGSPVDCPFRVRRIRSTVVSVRPHLCLLRLCSTFALNTIPFAALRTSAAAALVTESQTEQNHIHVGRADRALQPQHDSVTAYD